VGEVEPGEVAAALAGGAEEVGVLPRDATRARGGCPPARFADQEPAAAGPVRDGDETAARPDRRPDESAREHERSLARLVGSSHHVRRATPRGLRRPLARRPGLACGNEPELGDDEPAWRARPHVAAIGTRGVDGHPVLAEESAGFAHAVGELLQFPSRQPVHAPGGPQSSAGDDLRARGVLVDRLGEVPRQVQPRAHTVLRVAEVRAQFHGVDREAVLGDDVAVPEVAQQVTAPDRGGDPLEPVGLAELPFRGCRVAEFLQDGDVVDELGADVVELAQEDGDPRVRRDADLVLDCRGQDPSQGGAHGVRDGREERGDGRHGRSSPVLGEEEVRGGA